MASGLSPTKSLNPHSPQPNNAIIPIHLKPPLNLDDSKTKKAKSLPTKKKAKQSPQDVIISDELSLQ
eukprot:scaffold169967_cov24-Attheya_sp.AAC.1